METINAIMMLYENTIPWIVILMDIHIFCNIEVGNLQGDTLALLILVIILDYVLRTSID